MHPNEDPDFPPHCWLCGSRTQLPQSNTVPCVDCADGMKLGVWIVVVVDGSLNGKRVEHYEQDPPVFQPIGPMMCMNEESAIRLINTCVKAEHREYFIEKAKTKRVHFLPLSVALVSGVLGQYHEHQTEAVPEPVPGKPDRRVSPGYENRHQRFMPDPSEN